MKLHPQQRRNVLKGSVLGVALSMFIIFLAASYPAEPPSNDNTVDRIVIDAGHGGKDPGNLGTGRYEITEKTVALNVAKQVGEYIKKAFPDVEVLYTRDDDTFIPLHERTAFANTNQADLFISVHCDAFSRSSAVGCGSYVMGMAKTEANLKMALRENSAMLLEENQSKNYDGFDPNSPEGLIELSLRQSAHIHQSLRFAKLVQDQMRSRVGRVDRGVRQAPFWVISFTTMPSVLIELGFLTNHEEEDFLISEQGQTYLASAIYRAFKQYKTEIEGLDQNVVINEDGSVTNLPDKKTNSKESPAATPHLTKDITFKVQLLSSSQPIERKPENFFGMKEVEEYFGNEMFKYTVGSFSDFEQAKKLQEEMRGKGCAGAFVVAFDGHNQRMDIRKAIKASTEN